MSGIPPATASVRSTGLWGATSAQKLAARRMQGQEDPERRQQGERWEQILGIARQHGSDEEGQDHEEDLLHRSDHPLRGAKLREQPDGEDVSDECAIAEIGDRARYAFDRLEPADEKSGDAEGSDPEHDRKDGGPSPECDTASAWVRLTRRHRRHGLRREGEAAVPEHWLLADPTGARPRGPLSSLRDPA